VTIIDRVRLENKNMNIGRILGLGKKGEASGPNPSPQGTTRNGLPISLSRLQTFVSLGAGLVSIIGALVAMPNFFKSGPAKGELVAIVQEAKTDKALSDATIEVLTSQGALVTTLTPNSLGKASCTLEEGRYRVHVSHPRFGDAMREVQLVPRRTTEVRVPLRASVSFPRTIRRLFGR